MSIVRIYKPAKTAMQSGLAKTAHWLLEFELSTAKQTDHLMGWVGSRDMQSDQIRIKFASKNEAITFATKHGLEYEIKEPAERAVEPKSYADNFRPDRIMGNWTH
ncbi:ETC complex I subunit [Alphaproteobacteria bacterium]|nr:ETC complex I subunit [Alphaproteobacteria bacterium]